MRGLTMLDLFSGLGGASQVMAERGWRVVRLDIERKFKPTVVADALRLPLKPFDIDLLWASPVCTEFSKVGLRCFYPNPPEPDIAQCLAVKQAIEELKPKHWIVENVWASRPWLTQIFGPVRALVPGHALWSDMALLLPNIAPHKGSAGYWSTGRWGPVGHGQRLRAWVKACNRGSGILTGHNGIDAAEASLIPRELSEAICLAVERLNDRKERKQRLGV
jgi:site-specific DNA-cytosine methylase